MKFRILLLLTLLMSVGCYQRTTSPTYSFDQSNVERIREQLGAKTADKEYINEEPEEDE